MGPSDFLFTNRSNIALLLLCGALAASVGVSPQFVPTILLLSTALIYNRTALALASTSRPHTPSNMLMLWASLSIGQSIPRLPAAVTALSTTGVSFVSLALLSAINSLLVVIALQMDLTPWLANTTWSYISSFPTRWATLLFIVSQLSPIGRLSSWSPMDGLVGYRWMLPLVGTIGIDWVVAAWAIVISHIVKMWFLDEEFDEGERSLLLAQDVPTPTPAPPVPSLRKGLAILTAVLIALTLPSQFALDLPLPISASHSTPFSVGCVLPSYDRYKHSSPTFKDFLLESQKLTGGAKLLLWPEGAVRFDTIEERDIAFDKIRNVVTGSYVGVGFEETDNKASRSERRTGLALISKDYPKPYLIYYKRNLVPIAESFSLRHSMEPPGVYTIQLPHPKEVNKTEWAPPPNYTRPLAITASICLDFASPLPFNDLQERPALILAPARTWKASVGYAMWQHAKRRAEELGSIVLWCDGGDEGLSGIAGEGHNEIIQVGSGSWIRTIGIQYPFDERRTLSAYLGTWLITAMLLVTFGGTIGNLAHMPQLTGIALQFVRSRARRILLRSINRSEA